jgi:hypothetical protein
MAGQRERQSSNTAVLTSTGCGLHAGATGLLRAQALLGFSWAGRHSGIISHAHLIAAVTSLRTVLAGLARFVSQEVSLTGAEERCS